MTLRTWDLSDQLATHVRLVVLDNQCTGQPSYQGDQDNDPAVNADCLATARASEVHASELEVFGSEATVDGS